MLLRNACGAAVRLPQVVRLTCDRRSLGYFLLARCAVTLGVVSVYMSLYLSDMVIVAPLASLRSTAWCSLRCSCVT